MHKLRFDCIRCGTHLTVPDHIAGKDVRCPECKDQTVAPHQSQIRPKRTGDEHARSFPVGVWIRVERKVPYVPIPFIGFVYVDPEVGLSVRGGDAGASGPAIEENSNLVIRLPLPDIVYHKSFEGSCLK